MENDGNWREPNVREVTLNGAEKDYYESMKTIDKVVKNTKAVSKKSKGERRADESVNIELSMKEGIDKQETEVNQSPMSESLSAGLHVVATLVHASIIYTIDGTTRAAWFVETAGLRSTCDGPATARTTRHLGQNDITGERQRISFVEESEKGGMGILHIGSSGWPNCKFGFDEEGRQRGKIDNL